MTEEARNYWFFSLSGIGRARKFAILEAVSSINILYENAWNACMRTMLRDEEVERLSDPMAKEVAARDWDKMSMKGVSFVFFHDLDFPPVLKMIPDPPLGLCIKGSLPLSAWDCVAIVGARSCTPYGRAFALEYARALGRAGVAIVSGLARGIDGFAHRGALDVAAKTYAVLGCGVDICYPRTHIGLYSDIIDAGGGIISEYPLGMAPLTFHFPERNRIISGLSRALLVMEAKAQSGSLITADTALEQGRDVYALPGLADAPHSQGTHRLIEQGAGILISPAHLLELMGYGGGESSRTNKISLDCSENMVYSLLCLQPKSLDEIAIASGLPLTQVHNLLVGLQLQGLVKEIGRQMYVCEHSR